MLTAVRAHQPQCQSERPLFEEDTFAGIVKDCRLVSGCMHRFCSECIEKWLRVARCACINIGSRASCRRSGLDVSECGTAIFL